MKVFKKPQKKTIFKILFTIILALILTIVIGHIPHEHFHDFSSNKTYVSPYENPANQKYIDTLNSFNTTTLQGMTHEKDYFVLNGGGNGVVGITRVFSMPKKNLETISYEDYIAWTEENVLNHSTEITEPFVFKAYILFEDGSAIKYLDGTTTYITVNKFNFKYLNGFEQEIVQERRSRYSNNPLTFLNTDTVEKFEEFKNKVLY